MDKVKLDAATAEALKAAEPVTELVGPDGQTVGAFVPSDLVPLVEQAFKRLMIDEANAAVSLDQLRAAEASGEPVPHEEVMRRLGLER